MINLNVLLIMSYKLKLTSQIYLANKLMAHSVFYKVKSLVTESVTWTDSSLCFIK